MRATTSMAGDMPWFGVLFERFDNLVESLQVGVPLILLATFALASAAANLVVTGVWSPVYVDWNDQGAKIFGCATLGISALGALTPWMMLQRKRARNITLALASASFATAVYVFLGPDVPMLRWKNPFYLIMLALSLSGCTSAMYMFCRRIIMLFPWRRGPVYLRR